MTQRKDRIRVHIEGKEFSVVGGSFQEMLAAVKQINGRRFIGELKVWQLPGTVGEIQRQLEISGYQLEGGIPVAESARPETLPAQSGNRIRIVVGGHRLAVVGGSFQEMLAVVKGLPGRRFDSGAKVWEIPGDVGVIKGMIEAAGYNLEGAEKIPIDPVPPMEPPDFTGSIAPPPPSAFEPPDFLDDEAAPPFEPPDWWDDGPPPFVEEGDYPAELTPFEEPLSPTEPAPPGPAPVAASAPSGDRIRLQRGETDLIVTGGSFQEMLAVVKNIPGRRFNPEEKAWQIPAEVDLESIQQAVSAAGFILMEQQP